MNSKNQVDSEANTTLKEFNLITCSGIEKRRGFLTSLVGLAVRSLAEKDGYDCRLKPSFAQISIDEEDKWVKKLDKKSIYVLNGCNVQCGQELLAKRHITARNLSITTFIKKLNSADSLVDSSGHYDPEEVNQLAEIIWEFILKDLTPKKVRDSRPESLTSLEYTKIRELSYSKFIFKIPVKSGKMWYTWNDSWMYVENNHAYIGITDYMQKKLADILLFENMEKNTEIPAMEALATIESAKAVFEIMIPFTAKILEINTALLDNPELMNESPYDKGWVCKVEILETPLNFDLVMDADQYYTELETKVREEG